MELSSSRSGPPVPLVRKLLALVCAALLAFGEGTLLAQEAPQEAAAEPAAEKLSPDQLDSLVAPIALYPDPLLAQTLVAATYPLEIVQLQQWLTKNSNLKDKALADAVAKEPWDPAIQSMAAVPDVVKRLADDIQWTTQLGDAFLDQQNDVMDAVQRMRKKAEDKGALKSNEQQKVETKVIEEKTVIVVQPTNPEVIYVPSYNPTVVYPPPVYPYPPVYYPPYYPGTALVSFGVGHGDGRGHLGRLLLRMRLGRGNNTININNNNNFNRNSNVNRGGSGSGNWQHNSQHRGGAPYSNKATASKYGGSSRGGQGSGASRGGGATASTRSAGGAGGGSRGGGAAPSASSRGGGGGASAGSRGGGGGASAFGGGSGGYSGSSSRASSSRGSSSMSSSRGGGGGSRGGGGGGGRRR